MINNLNSFKYSMDKQLESEKFKVKISKLQGGWILILLLRIILGFWILVHYGFYFCQTPNRSHL